MPFDLGAAMRVAGNTPDMYENQRQALEDLRTRAQNDPSFRQQMVTQRARQGYMGHQSQEPAAAPQAIQPVAEPVAAAIQAEEALKQLRMERARQHWERSFGQAHSGGQSMASQGQQENINALLKRIEMARQMHNWRPG